MIDKKRVLITGGTGSFGSKVAQFLANNNVGEIIIFSRDEKKQYEMKKIFPDFKYMLGDVRDLDRVRLATKNVDLIFHAAALKHVPACEENPIEAVKTNIYGTENICLAALENNIERVVGLSTDKAVKPINAMGISKAMLEKIICSQNQNQTNTIFSCVRYGNVMGSRGSVIPYFKSLLKEGRKLKITVPEMTRFLMTLDESVDLVRHALTNAQGGEIFVRKSPASTIIDLAKAMIIKESDGDFERMEVVGIRPGEKMDEVLVNEYEILRSEENENYFKISPEYVSTPLNSEYPMKYEYSSDNTLRIKDLNQIIELLKLVDLSTQFD